MNPQISQIGAELFRTGYPKGYPCLVATAHCVERYTSGASLETLAREAGQSINNVRNALMRAGATMRPAGRPVGTRNPDGARNRKITLMDEAQIVIDRMNGHSARALAAFYGISKTRVLQILRARGCTTSVTVTVTKNTGNAAQPRTHSLSGFRNPKSEIPA